MKKQLFFFMTAFLSAWILNAQNENEKLLVNENFQNWSAVSSSKTETVISKKTSFSNEDFTYKISEIQVNPTGWDASKFNADVASTGYLMAAKSATPYIEISSLASITKVEFIHGATGKDRGYQLWKKAETDEDWVSVSNAYANPASGTKVTVNINDENVALKFTNLNSGQNAYLFDLKIYGNYVSTVPQVSLTTSVNMDEAGSITRSVIGETYDEGTTLTLTANENFGYKFQKWVDSEGTTLSSDLVYELTLDSDKTVSAVFVAIPTYSLEINTSEGANNYLVSVSPQGNVINGITYYEEGTDIRIEASSNNILTFTSWNDGSTENVKTFTINENINLTANYSATDFIVGWDMHYDEPKKDRAADYFSVPENRGMLSLHKADGTSAGWLAKGLINGKYEGRYAAVNWQSFTNNDNYYYEISFSTQGFTNVKVQAAMLFNYNAFSIQKVEYSIDGNEYKDLGSYTMTTAKTWYEEEFTLPQEAWGVERVYVRYIPDYTSSVVGSTSSNDGTAITDIYVMADSESANDEVPPILLSSLPENTITDVSANGSIILTFDERVIEGVGDCTLNGEKLDAVFSGKTVVFKYSGLAYNTLYTFNVPSGAITDRSGNAFDGCEITFTTMQRTQPTAKLFDAIVAADGSGDYETVSAAISAAPANRIAPYLIFIKEGTYKEHIEIPATKPFIHLIGQDVDKVTITDDRLSGETDESKAAGKDALHVSQGATVVVLASDFYAENISFENSWGIEKNAGPQALALYSNNDRIILNNCKLRSYQDTYLTSTRNIADRHYLKNCFIEGAVDFIYGGGDVFFDECTLNIVRKSGGYIVAPSHKEGTAWGYVFMNNTITAPAPASGTSVWLGRPWKDAPKTVFINTKAEVAIPAAGWHDNMGAIPAIFADYNTVDANGVPLDLSNRIEDYWYWADDTKTNKITGKAKKSLTDQEATTYTAKNVLTGNDNWDPVMLTEKIEKPVSLSFVSNTLTWSPVDYTICYIILKNGEVIAFTKETEYEISSLRNSGNDDEYAVQAVSASGSLSPISESVTKGVNNNISNSINADIKYEVKNNILYLENLPENSHIEVYNMLGSKILNQQANSTACSIELKSNCIVRILSSENNITFKVVL